MKTTIVKMIGLGCMALAISLNACKKDNSGPVIKAPKLTTNDVTGLKLTDATLNASIINTGGADISQCGFVWSSTQANPTLADKEGFTEEGPHNDQFSHLSPDFNPNASYYIRAYATNIKGTAYGETKLIVFDVSANLYHTIKIGNQIWMLENLKATMFADNLTNINYSQNDWIIGAEPKRCAYNNLLDNSAIYGFLYNWYAVNDAKGLAPSGWHIPTQADWNQLITTVNNGDANTAGIMLKEATVNNPNSHWTSFAGISSTNASGFTALPGGYRRNDNLNFAYLGQYGHFWVAGEDNGTVTYVRLDYGTDKVNFFSSATFNNSPTKNFGFSVRCVMNP